MMPFFDEGGVGGKPPSSANPWSAAVLGNCDCEAPQAETTLAATISETLSHDHETRRKSRFRLIPDKLRSSKVGASAEGCPCNPEQDD